MDYDAPMGRAWLIVHLLDLYDEADAERQGVEFDRDVKQTALEMAEHELTAALLTLPVEPQSTEETKT